MVDIVGGIDAVPVGAARRIDPQHVVANDQMMVADALGELGKIPQHHRVGAEVGHGEADSQFHHSTSPR